METPWEVPLKMGDSLCNLNLSPVSPILSVSGARDSFPGRRVTFSLKILNGKLRALLPSLPHSLQWADAQLSQSHPRALVPHQLQQSKTWMKFVQPWRA